MRLDRHKPHGVVQGLPGVSFQQHGHYFNGDGHLVVDPEAPAVPEASPILGPDGLPISKTAPEEAVLSGELQSGDAPAAPLAVTDSGVAKGSASPSISRDDMRLKENKALKFQMEAYGQEWRGVEHARKYLEAK